MLIVSGVADLLTAQVKWVLVEALAVVVATCGAISFTGIETVFWPAEVSSPLRICVCRVEPEKRRAPRPSLAAYETQQTWPGARYSVSLVVSVVAMPPTMPVAWLFASVAEGLAPQSP